ncbi:MAG: hypothetical protein ACRC80_31295 [Waterburya sp.]
MSILLWCGIKWAKGKRFGYDLKSVAERLLNKGVDKTEQKSDWSQPLLSNSQLNYAATDVVVTYDCFMELCKRLRKWDSIPDLFGNPCKYKLTEIAKIECEAIPAFVEMVLTGQPVDIEKAKEVKAQYEKAIDDLYKPVLDKIKLPYSAQSIKLTKAISEVYNIQLKNSDGANSSKSSVLFEYYCQTKEEDLLRLSLVRSLKKSVDAIEGLILSSELYNGYARGGYVSLGNTGSGRSTCGSDRKNKSNPSTFEALNLQNLPNPIEHPLLEKYRLPSIRSIITNKSDKGMFLQDLSASHLRLAASNSGDGGLIDILSLKDPHALVTSQMFGIAGKPRSMDYCLENRKTDADVQYYRSIAKVALYTQFNDGKAFTFKQSLNKSFVNVSIEDCEKAQQALVESFPGYTSYARKLAFCAKKKVVDTEYGRFSRFRTHDGRLFHVEERKKTNRQGEIYTSVKLGEVTSAMLISPEALVMKKALIDILVFLRANRHLPIKLNSFTHDDLSGEDLTEGKVFAKFVYKTIATHFTEALDVDSGLNPEDTKAYKSILISNYSEK